MAIINKLIVTFDYRAIDKAYDFYVVTTSDKYISNGAYILDKPIETLKAESVVFDNGRSLFVMFKKNAIGRIEFGQQIIDEKTSLRQVSASDIKDYILFRLFLYSLNNFNSDEIKYNNVTGKLFITNCSWVSRDKNYFKALNINVDQNMCIVAEAATFTRLSLFSNKKIEIEYPKYIFANKNNSLKRTLDKEGEDIYIRKSIFGIKAEIPFFEFSPKKLRNNKVFYIYHTLDLLAKKFNGLFAFSFKEIDVSRTIGKSREKKIDDIVHEIAAFKDFNLINWSNSSEYDDEFDDIVKIFTLGRLGNVSQERKIVNGAYNLVFLHSKDYYAQHKYNDPYKNFPSNEVVQHITIEDSVSKIIDNDEAIYNTVLKEMIIKDDLINKNKISLDNWESFGYEKDFVFGKEKDGKHHFIVVKPNGSFDLLTKVNDLKPFGNIVLDKCSLILTSNKGKEKTIISDSYGNIILISRSPMFSLPNKRMFDLESISRDKESRENNLSGVVDINVFDTDGKTYYSVGIQGSGMQTSIPKAAHLYEVELIQGKNIIDELLETMAVSFVKYKSFTVMPYPIKYLNEYILLCENSKE